MKFRLEIEMDNASFEDDPGAELASILRNIANDVDRVGGAGSIAIEFIDCPILDLNGNRIGMYTTTSEWASLLSKRETRE